MKDMKKKISMITLTALIAIGAGVTVAFVAAPKPEKSCGIKHSAEAEKKELHHEEAKSCNTEKREVSQKENCKTDCSKEKVRDTTPIAKVNGVPIPHNLLFSALKDRQQSGDTSSTLREDILDNLITVELLYQEAKNSGIKLSIGAGTIRADAVKRARKDPENFNKLLEERGLTPEEYQHQWYRQATINMYIEEQIQATVEVKDRTLKKLYKRLQKSSDQPLELSFEDSREILKEMYVKEKTQQLVDRKIAFLKKSSDIEYL